MQSWRFRFLIIWAGIIFILPANAQTDFDESSAIKQTQNFVNEVVRKSFPEINLEKIKIKTFTSDSNFFKARFSYTRFFTFQKMRYLLYVNPKVYNFNVPENALKAIIAHELAHILYYTERNRCELLGLVRLTSGGFTSDFERRTDLTAIERGFGEGLMEYRRWLYRIIPESKIESKRKDYFSPEEIELILETTKQRPEMFRVWRKKVPNNLYEIKKSIE